MCSSVFPHQKSKTSRGKSIKDMDKCVEKKNGETSAGARKEVYSLKKRHSTYIIRAHTESLKRHKQLREYD